LTEERDEGFAISESDLPDRHMVDPTTLGNQDDYGRTAFELLQETSLLTILLVHAMPDEPFQRNEAIRRGLIKRLGMLTKALLSDIAHDSGYQQEVIVREIVEVVANYFYLADDDESGERHDAYVLNTLAEEKASLAVIAAQMKERGDGAWPIEERMRSSIERMASVAGVDFDTVPGKKKIAWPSAFDRLAALDPAAYMPYRTGSNAIHAGWTALLLRDIEQVDGGFTMENGPSPSVQAMTAASLLTASSVVHYLEVDGSEVEREWLGQRLVDASERIRSLDEAHERFLHDLADEGQPDSAPSPST
jgi:Family of unknown function (DUF5677)